MADCRADCLHTELDQSTLEKVFSKLDTPEDLAICSCVCQTWKSIASSNRLWESRLLVDFGLLKSENTAGWPGPPPQASPGIRRAKQAWRNWNAALKASGAYAQRQRLAARKACELNRRWRQCLNDVGLGAIVATFQPGVPAEELDQLEEALGVRLPHALRMLWMLNGGQPLPGRDGEVPFVMLGAFGGYMYYQCIQSMHFMMPQESLRFTRQAVQAGQVPASSVMIGVNILHRKSICVDCETGVLYVGLPNQGRADPQVASPQASRELGLEQRDVPLLMWLENLVQMLEDGVVAAEDICRELHAMFGVDSSLGVSLFPNSVPRPCMGIEYTGPCPSECTTRGVWVRARPLFIPEVARVDRGQLSFAYSITMQLLEGHAVRTCQLVRRQWVIRGEHEEVLDEVEGEGVVGEFPVLTAGGPPFTYQSCTSAPVGGGSMEGHFEFVNGRMDPESLDAAQRRSLRQADGEADEGEVAVGETFRVAVARFHLRRPRFLY